MPANLKGSAEVTVPADAKPGDKFKVEGITFEVEQDDFERSLRTRLSQQKRQHETELAELDKTHKEELAKLGKGDKEPEANKATEKMEKELAEMKAKFAQAELQGRLTAALAAAGLDKAPAVYRNSVTLKADASDDDIAEAVKKLSEDPDLQKLLGTETTEPTIKAIGNRGGSGGADKGAEDKHLALMRKAELNQPKLHRMLAGMEPEQQKTTLADWEAQGSLEAKK